MPIPSDKNYLRNFYLQKRYLLSQEEFKSINDGLLRNFITINFNKVNILNTFIGITDKGEPDTISLINNVRLNYPKVKITAPKVNFNDYSLSSVLLDPNTQLEVNKWNILEPQNTPTIDKRLIDVMIVPLVCVDKRGYRIGYGKGFYDRFINECREDMLTIGLSLFPPIDKIEQENHDIKLKACITPSEIIYFKK
ncbi:MAG: 5-formyltetrahydrofolate cyclo-ligase [Solitalea-like symbiont of Acarus siro]